MLKFLIGEDYDMQHWHRLGGAVRGSLGFRRSPAARPTTGTSTTAGRYAPKMRLSLTATHSNCWRRSPTTPTWAGRTGISIQPELGYGVLPNTQLSLRLPLGVHVDSVGSAGGLGGAQLSALYNFNAESRSCRPFRARRRVAAGRQARW